MSEVNYSIIIPHKNSPGLLKRCVDSIPERDDVQIVVVDDNSEEKKKPALLERKGLEIVLLDASQSKGAGRARNIGLSKAKGKWLLFADADDFFSNKLPNILDSYINSPFDLIFFKTKGVDSDTLQPTGRGDGYNKLVSNYLGNLFLSENELRFFHFVPWGKLIRRSIIEENEIKFEEIRYSNDMMFACKCGYYAKRIAASPLELYYITARTGSLVTQVSRESRECRLGAGFRRCNFVYSNRRWSGLITYHRTFLQFRELYGKEGIRNFGAIMKENDLGWGHLIWFEVVSLMIRYIRNVVRLIQKNRL